MTFNFWRDLVVIAFAVVILGVVSALHIGLSTLDPLYRLTMPCIASSSLLSASLSRTLKILKEGGSAREKGYARVVLPLIERHHWLLVSLVIVTAVCAMALRWRC